MFLGAKFIDKQIISLDEGRIVGKVEDFYIDRDLNQVVGLYLGSDGFIRRKPKVIKREAIQLYGVDVLFVETSSVVIGGDGLDELEGLDNWLRRDDLEGRQIVSATDAEVAKIEDIYFNEDGQILGFGLAKIKVKGPIAENLAIKREVVIEAGNDEQPMKIDLIKAEQQHWFFKEH